MIDVVIIMLGMSLPIVLLVSSVWWMPMFDEAREWMRDMLE